MKSIVIILPIYFACFKSAAKLNKQFKLMPESCMVTGEQNGVVTSSSGQNAPLICELNGKVAKCGQTTPSEEYVLEGETPEVFLIKSKSGNIFILGDVKNKRYSMASSHLIAEKAMLMTKHCTGKFQ